LDQRHASARLLARTPANTAGVLAQAGSGFLLLRRWVAGASIHDTNVTASDDWRARGVPPKPKRGHDQQQQQQQAHALLRASPDRHGPSWTEGSTLRIGSVYTIRITASEPQF
jgi:hypothetical protein